MRRLTCQFVEPAGAEPTDGACEADATHTITTMYDEATIETNYCAHHKGVMEAAWALKARSYIVTPILPPRKRHDQAAS